MRSKQLTAKDMTELKEQDSAKEQVKQTRGSLRDYSGQHKVEVFWDLSPECIKDMICRIKIDDYEVLVDAEQLRRLLRWV